MNKELVLPVLQKYRAHNNRNSLYYKDLIKSVTTLEPDIYDNPTLKSRALASITWPPGKEPFQCIVDARPILAS